MDPILNSPEIARLCTIVEEATRSSEEGVKYFVEPAGGSLRRATSRRHHIIFGRRGSGKSSLLRKAASDLTVERRPIAWVDLEAFKGHTYPDLLLSVLIASFRAFKNWLETAAVAPAHKTSFWRKFFGRSPTKAAFNRKACAHLVNTLATNIKDLETQLHASDSAELQIRRGMSQSVDSGTEFGARVGIAEAHVTAKTTDTDKNTTSWESQESYRRSKVDFLRRHIMDYQQVFDATAKMSDGDSYLFLDDLYHIRKDDQPKVVDYFHSVGKGHNLWLKIGTIRHRSEWYVHGHPPIGVKLGDDAEEIDLDLTLEKYALAKEFLVKVLSNLTQSANLANIDFLTDGAIDRLVLASGGVARDFLSIFRRAVDVARERNGDKINAEDINVAAGEYDTSKREEFKRDVYSEEEVSLDKVFQDVVTFCLETANSNCFLLDKDAKNPKVEFIHELVDLKLLHLVRTRVTVQHRQGRIYEAYMLDLSQYAGSRKRRGLETIEFWKPETKEKLRRATLIYSTDEGKSSEEELGGSAEAADR